MAKQTTRKPAKGTTPAAQAPAAPAASTPVIQVLRQPTKPYRQGSARALYWAAVQAHNGQPVTALAASIAANPPSQPKRGKLAGQTEPLTGWLAWFKAQGVLAIG